MSADQFCAFLKAEQGVTLKTAPQTALATVKAQIAELLASRASGAGSARAEEARHDGALSRFAKSAVQAASREETRPASGAGEETDGPGDADTGASARAAAGAEAEAADPDQEAARKAGAAAARKDAAGAGSLSLQEFAAYITSPEVNGPLMSSRHDMTRPLSHYFVSSTHNSYLSGNQLNGVSTADAIRRALALGARVIELDCYSAETASAGTAEPWVTHGGTLTSKLPFREAVRAVAEYAFRPGNVVPTRMPVILTLENHCSASGQELQATILREELGDLLYVPPTPRPARYPSPAALEGMVVLRDKPGRMLEYEGSDASPGAAAAAAPDDVDVEEDDDEAAQEAAQARAIAAKGGAASAASAAAPPPGAAKGKHKKVLHPALCALVAVPNVKFTGFDKLDRYSPGPASSSFSEEKMEGVAKGAKAKGSAGKVATLAQTHLVRVYPKGVRVDSSNFDPARFWALGCQLAALNYQYGDRSVHSNQAFFSQNGGYGYVLKPDWMLADGGVAEFDHTGRSPPPGVTKQVLDVTVISGHMLPKPRSYSDGGDIIDPFVEVHVVGAPCDTALHTTGVVDDNGFNPRWSDPSRRGLKPSATFTVCRPDVATLLFVVQDKNVGASVVVAQAGIPLRALRTGIRALPLCDSLSVPLPAAKLMVDVRVRDA